MKFWVSRLVGAFALILTVSAITFGAMNILGDPLFNILGPTAGDVSNPESVAKIEAAEAQFNLGVMYSKGQGVPQGYAEAVRWYRLAAEQGFAEAQTNLGTRYALGQGVPQNYVRAHMWFNLSSANGAELGSENRDITAGEMTPVDILIAERLARECMAKGYKGC